MSIFKKMRLTTKFLFDNNVPLREKIGIILFVIYAISPIDLIPDPVLGFGIVDDLVLMTYVLNKLSEKLNEYEIRTIRNKKEEDIKGEIIENVEYEVKDNK